jgi:hypothetical protein
MKLFAREPIMIRKLVLVALLCVAASTVFAQGSTDEEAACRPDVRRFCHAIKEGGNFLGCLQEHRAKLRRQCRAVLESHGM